MSKAYASAVIDAPIERVWSIVRDFNGLPDWTDGVRDSMIEGGLRADVVGCVRSFHLINGALVRERLLLLDDHRHRMSYNFETPAFPVDNYIATLKLRAVTSISATFCEWEATFDERPNEKGVYEKIISDNVFAANWSSLARKFGG